MTKSFQQRLESVKGKTFVVDFTNDYSRFGAGPLYYSNRAEILYDSAVVIWSTGAPLQFDVAAMLTGMAIEVLLKGIRLLFDLPASASHNLITLCDEVGINVESDDRIILASLTEHIYWAGRYPVALSANRLDTAKDIFGQQHRTGGNLANYDVSQRANSKENCERLWKLFMQHFYAVSDARPQSVESRDERQ